MRKSIYSEVSGGCYSSPDLTSVDINVEHGFAFSVHVELTNDNIDVINGGEWS